jgi:hypothetical protein
LAVSCLKCRNRSSIGDYHFFAEQTSCICWNLVLSERSDLKQGGSADYFIVYCMGAMSRTMIACSPCAKGQQERVDYGDTSIYENHHYYHSNDGG